MIERLHLREQLPQQPREGARPGFLYLPPAWLCTEDDVLLPARGNDGNVRRGIEHLAHTGFVALAERNPEPANNEVAVITGALGAGLPELRRERGVLVGEAELAGIADDVSRLQLVVVREGVPNPLAECHPHAALSASTALSMPFSLHRWTSRRLVYETGYSVHQRTLSGK